MLIVSTRQLGKTEEMIKAAYDAKGILVVHNKPIAGVIARRAEESKMPLKLVIDVHRFLNKEYMLDLIKENVITGHEQVFIDDIEVCFRSLLFALNRSRETVEEPEMDFRLEGASAGPGIGQIKVISWTDPNYIPKNKQLGCPEKEYEMAVKNVWTDGKI